ncbi:dTDP-4-dehydrorhamnose 3,5-epimerase [Candidatus Cyanaurora vandensis]|uniref:dTDP-4-dehydrorhamnose 3,5-epimerase n=1 Tax=Candidatus Cyanaurora vandensis TaxID=2714958 RepID=UPI00257CFDC4|nr:dTDP-4-dehydrorhamnose 3,5-epimerase [Candidatus Cyanaurora vandensis]
MQPLETALPGVYLLEPKLFADSRGYFFESYQQQKFADMGITSTFVQDNRSYSKQGSLRGLHYQLHHPQAKLCTVLTGEVYDVAVDIRQGSPNFGHWVGVVLSGENKRQIYIPRGFAHGFVVLSQTAEFMYKCDEFYYPQDERGILWDDPALGITWGMADPILSDKDRQNPALNAIPAADLPTYP